MPGQEATLTALEAKVKKCRLRLPGKSQTTILSVIVENNMSTWSEVINVCPQVLRVNHQWHGK